MPLVEVAIVASTTIEPRTMRGIQVAVPEEPMSVSPAMVASASAGPPENWVISALMPCFLVKAFLLRQSTTA